MKLLVRVGNGITAEVDGPDHKSLFQGVCEAQNLADELFGDSKCGVCGSENVRCQIRTVEDNHFYEMVCKAPGCWAKLSYGHSKTGGKMYPRRMEVDGKGKALKDKNDKGIPLPNKGWLKYNKETGKNE